LAIASVLSRRPVRRDVAMTGEVTLRGRVLEIGGVKEKVLAAYRAGLREVILPVSNQKDLREVPDEVRANMAFTFASTLDEVLRHALLAPAETDGAAPAKAANEVPIAPTPIIDTPRVVAHTI
jgi:ATP-dependent Lon protease